MASSCSLALMLMSAHVFISEVKGRGFDLLCFRFHSHERRHRQENKLMLIHSFNRLSAAPQTEPHLHPAVHTRVKLIYGLRLFFFSCSAFIGKIMWAACEVKCEAARGSCCWDGSTTHNWLTSAQSYSPQLDVLTFSSFSCIHEAWEINDLTMHSSQHRNENV